MLRNGLLRASLGLLLGVCVGSQALAGISVSGTRVVFDGAKREASVAIRNIGATPYLVQSWVEVDAAAGDSEQKPPLVVTPPLSRLNGNKENILRIVRIKDDMPQDRESLFWLNVKEIPPKAQGENLLQIALRTRIKLFYRPAALDKAAVFAAPKALKWSIVPAAGGGRAHLKVENPTPFFITLASLKVTGPQAQELKPNMVAPFGSSSYALASTPGSPESKVEYVTINDYGGYSDPIAAAVR